MNRKANKPFIRWCILGAVGCGFMAAGDWLLGCIPLQETDTGLFNRVYYLSGSYGLWRPVLTVGLGAIGGFLYYFVVKALNADIDEKYRKTKSVHNQDLKDLKFLYECLPISDKDRAIIDDYIFCIRSREQRMESYIYYAGMMDSVNL